ncbi:MAG: 30S ribosomal protein S2 [Candidatus Liptonbacteria bacterium]|nr:30S ribosomal protein S2 [Candidatus Liptonbacteria bacterium]
MALKKIDIIEEENKEMEVASSVALSAEDFLMLQEMVDLGMLYGLSKSKTNPKMKDFIHSTRGGIEIINLEETIKLIKSAVVFLKEIIATNKKILFIGTTPISKSAIYEISEKLDQPYIVERWIGGTLTNFKVISKRLEAFRKLILDKEKGELEKYTKKEQLMFDRQIQKMEKLFGGIKNMKDLPGALFIVSPQKHETAIREAKHINIPVVAILSTNFDPTTVDYPIPANDKNIKSVAWLVNYFMSNLQTES